MKRRGVKEFLKLESSPNDDSTKVWIAEQEGRIRDICKIPREKIDIMDRARMASSSAIVGANMAAKGAYLSFRESEQGWWLLRKSIL